MIGGPTDVVVEPNIVRATSTAPARETPPARVPARHRRYAAARRAARRRRDVAAAAGAASAARFEPPWTRTPTGRCSRNRPRAPPPDIAPRAAGFRAASSAPRPISRAARAKPKRPPRRAAMAKRGAQRRPAPVQPIPEHEDQNLAEMAQRLEIRAARRETRPPRRRSRSRRPPAAGAPSRAPAAREAEPAELGREPSQPAPPRSPPSTASSRRWRACSAVRPEKRERSPHPAAVFVLRRWWPE